MRIFALDPGNDRSGYVLFDLGENRLILSGDEPNTLVRAILALYSGVPDVHLVVEKPALIGQQIWHQILDTCIWLGQAVELFGCPERTHYMTRGQVKKALLGRSNVPKADTQIIQVLLERFPGGKGTKKAPGPLYGIKGDAWQALALAVAYSESR